MNIGFLIMLPIAILLDVLGVICTILDIAFGAGEIISWITDIAGTIIIGGWIFFNFLMRRFITKESEEKTGEKIKEIKDLSGKKKKLASKVQKLVRKLKGKKGILRVVGGIIGEYIPIVGILPFWTWIVWSERKK